MMTEVREAISAADLDRVRALFEHWTPPAIAAEIKDLTRVEQAVVIRVLPRQTAAAVFEFLDRHTQEDLLKAMGQEEVGSILNNMAPDDRTRLLEESPAEVTKQLLAVLTPEERRTALSLLGYPAGSIGRLMTPHHVAIKEDWTVTPHTGGKAVQSFLRYGFVIALMVIVRRVWRRWRPAVRSILTKSDGNAPPTWPPSCALGQPHEIRLRARQHRRTEPRPATGRVEEGRMQNRVQGRVIRRDYEAPCPAPLPENRAARAIR